MRKRLWWESMILDALEAGPSNVDMYYADDIIGIPTQFSTMLACSGE